MKLYNQILITGFIIILFNGMIESTWAQTKEIQDLALQGWEWIIIICDENVEKTKFPLEYTKTTKNEAIELCSSGSNVGNYGILFMFSMHDFVVNIILGGSPIPLDVTITGMISAVFVLVLVLKFWKKIGKHLGMLFIILAIIVLAFLALGTNIRF